MKRVISLTIQNVGKVENAKIALDKPLILFYGEIRQGKTTILNCVRWVCGGSYPQDIIKHGESEAFIELAFTDGTLSRSWYKGKDGTTKAREISYVVNGKPVKSPVAEIKRLLNPFLLDQDFLRNKSELERRKFFVELFQVDTSALDTELVTVTREAEILRAQIKGYGDIELKPVESVDVSALRAELALTREGYKQACSMVDARNEQIIEYNSQVDDTLFAIDQGKAHIAELEDALTKAKARLAQNEEFIASNPRKSLEELPSPPDTTELEARIENGAATNVRAEQYQKDKERAEAKANDERTLLAKERRTREIRDEKLAKLKGISDSCGINGLSFDEEGNFIYEETTAGMISDSQIMRLSSELSSLYPEGFGLDLIDRGESLGKSIFDFVERAEKESKTILATIVGEKPAVVPENIGVFVVNDGEVIPA